MQKKSTIAAEERQRYLQYSKNHSVTATAKRYRRSRKTVYKWLKVWDGTKESVEDRSRRPKHSPRKTSEEELKAIRKRLKQCRWTDLILAYQLLVERDGYTRSYGGFKQIARKLKEQKPKKRKKKKPQPYERAAYPGQKVQMDVKYVPKECTVNGKQYYQYTATDECTRWTYRELYEEQSTDSSKDFLLKLIRKAPFPIRMVQTDNGSEFTNALLVVKAKHKSAFEKALEELGMEYHRIRIATPRHNGKVERQHRIDAERFYSRMRMYSLEDGRKQLEKYQRMSNSIMKSCLGMKTPNQMVELYRGVM